MQDRHKYRAWDKKDKRLIVQEQDFIPLKICSLGVLRLNPKTEGDNWKIIDDNERFDLMQCTGLKDKNGRLIWEGDILKVFAENSDYSENLKVEFSLGQFGAVIREPMIFSPLFDLNLSGCEVIGNIYENGELLNG